MSQVTSSVAAIDLSLCTRSTLLPLPDLLFRMTMAEISDIYSALAGSFFFS